MRTIVNMLYDMFAKRIKSKKCHHKGKNTSCSVSIKIMDVNSICCRYHSIIYVSQVIMLYTLKLYSVACQLFLNKTERIKENLVSMKK